jgi:hypothetical protein
MTQRKREARARRAHFKSCDLKYLTFFRFQFAKPPEAGQASAACAGIRQSWPRRQRRHRRRHHHAGASLRDGDDGRGRRNARAVRELRLAGVAQVRGYDLARPAPAIDWRVADGRIVLPTGRDRTAKRAA